MISFKRMGRLTAAIIAGSLMTGGVVWADASNNTVNVKNETVSSTFAGGSTASGNANDNIVNISGDSTVINNGFTYGGNTTSGNVSGNTVNISSGTINSRIHAGNVVSGNASNNTVNVSGGNFTGGWISGAYIDHSGEASNNVANISGGTFNVSYIEGSWGSGTHIGNKVNITGGNINGGIVSGTWVTDSTTASKNETNILGGTIKNSTAIAGAYIVEGYTGNAFDNVVNISGNAVIENSAIYGGWAPSGEASNNVINIYGSPNLESATLYAGKSKDGATPTGNKLNIYTKNITAKNIYGFEELNFDLPADTESGDYLLTLTDGTTNLSSTKVGLTSSLASNLKTGDTVNLLTNTSGSGSITTSDITLEKIKQGASYAYDLTWDVEEINSEGTETSAALISETSAAAAAPSGPHTSLVATIGERSKNERLDGIDQRYVIPYVVDPDLPARTEFELATEKEQKSEWVPVLHFGSRWMRVDGSGGAYSKTRLFSSNIGMARNFDSGNKGKLLIAPLIDYGGGEYDSYAKNDMMGRGAAHYWAGGAVLRKTNENGVYVGGSLRYGRVTSDYATDDIWEDHSMHVSYDTASRYWAGHVDFGRILDLDRENKLDVYGIYFFNHLGSASAKLSSGEQYSFDSVMSSRVRVGTRLTRYVGEHSRFYSGIAYQYESIGAATGHYDDITISDGGVKGSSGMIELGWQFKPQPDAPVAINVSAVGWVGHQRGGSIQAKFERAF